VGHSAAGGGSGKTVQAASELKAGPLYDLIGIRLEGADNDVKLSTVYPGRSLTRPFRGESKLAVDLRIRMPYDANVALHCVDGDVRIFGITGREQLRVNYGDVEINVPDVYRLRSFDAHTWIGYVENDIHGIESDAAGLRQRILFYNAHGDQDIRVRVRMGGIWVYSTGNGNVGP
jgi:hypothetical protein